tara:strand:- start:958 stop:1386 length:429 start_codon:yes stop_codon:yes gene_type:complete
MGGSLSAKERFLARQQVRADGDDSLCSLRDSGGIKVGAEAGHFSDQSYQVALCSLQYRLPEPGRELCPEQEATKPRQAAIVCSLSSWANFNPNTSRVWRIVKRSIAIPIVLFFRRRSGIAKLFVSAVGGRALACSSRLACRA